MKNWFEDFYDKFCLKSTTNHTIVSGIKREIFQKKSKQEFFHLISGNWYKNMIRVI